MAVTNNEDLATSMQELRSHGVTRDKSKITSDASPWVYEQHNLGFNYRMTDIHAALGLSQLSRLESFVARRRQLAARYQEKLARLPITLPVLNQESAWHLYIIQLHDTGARRAVFETMRSRGIGVNVHYIPVHSQPYYRELGFETGDFPLAESYYQGAITLPLFYSMTDDQQDQVIEALRAAIEEHCQ